jgi:hypothetical protein
MIRWPATTIGRKGATVAYLPIVSEMLQYDYRRRVRRVPGGPSRLF